MRKSSRELQQINIVLCFLVLLGSHKRDGAKDTTSPNAQAPDMNGGGGGGLPEW